MHGSHIRCQKIPLIERRIHGHDTGREKSGRIEGRQGVGKGYVPVRFGIIHIHSGHETGRKPEGMGKSPPHYGKIKGTLAEVERAFHQCILQRQAFEIIRHHPFHPGHGLPALIIDEHDFIDDRLRRSHSRKGFQGLQQGVREDESLAAGGFYQYIGLDHAFAGADNGIEPVVNRKYEYESRRTHRHARSADGRYNVYDIMRLACEQIAQGYEKRQSGHFFRSSSICST